MLLLCPAIFGCCSAQTALSLWTIGEAGIASGDDEECLSDREICCFMKWRYPNPSISVPVAPYTHWLKRTEGADTLDVDRIVVSSNLAHGGTFRVALVDATAETGGSGCVIRWGE